MPYHNSQSGHSVERPHKILKNNRFTGRSTERPYRLMG